MAATSYASVVSLMQTIDHVMEHGHNSFDLNHDQILSVHKKAAFLLEFLECYSSGDNKEVEALELQISNAAHGVEDVIENKVVHYIRNNQSTNLDRVRTNLQRLKKVIRVMDLVINKAMEIKEKKEVKVELTKDLMPSASSSSLPVGNKNMMVGFDDVKIQIMDRLTRQQESTRLVIPISGMGGIGKTTLTRYVYETPLIVNHFDVRCWITISQEYQIKEILSNLLIEFKVQTKEPIHKMNESELGENIHKHLFGRRYLIVMDDMWNIDAWEKLQLFFPENGNGSRIMITSRLTIMASRLSSSGLEMDFLDEDQSWNLLRQKVFGQQQECTDLELEEIGKKIAKNCKGLPLSIVVIAGLLSKSNMTPDYWHGVAEKVSSIVSEADDGQCLRILSMSYVNLPVHLKPCFLYMGVFPEDHQINVSYLIQLWVAEGFLKPDKIKSLEEVAEEYLMDLIDRNLIMVYGQHGLTGNVIHCKIHDLLRDLCIMEAHKEKFFCVANSFDSSQALHNQRRIVIDRINQNVPPSLVLRSITCYNNDLNLSFLGGGRLIRVLHGNSSGSSRNIVNLVNLRYLNYRNYDNSEGFKFSFISNLLWNIQTIVLTLVESVKEQVEIWKMKQLRCLCSRGLIGTIDHGQEDDTSIKHLHTLTEVRNLILSKDVVKRISNIKILDLYYYQELGRGKLEYYCLGNLQHLHKLEHLDITFGSDINEFVRNILYPVTPKDLDLSGTCKPWEEEDMTSCFPSLQICFPQSLKELILWGTLLSCEDMKKIGCLPNLHLLRLGQYAYIGEEWTPIEGQFISLKCLEIRECNNLKVWNAESIHFPVLEVLYLQYMHSLEEIPFGIGEIPTLRCIILSYCSDSIVRSAIDILDEQESLGNTDLKVEVRLRREDTQLQNLEERDNLKLTFITTEK